MTEQLEQRDDRQYQVVFLGAGDDSPGAREAVAQRLAEKFNAPYEKILAGVSNSPRVFKRNLPQSRAESLVRLLEELGARAEIRPGANTPPGPPSAAAVPDPAANEATGDICSLCGRQLQPDGSCVICRFAAVPDPPAADTLAPLPAMVEPAAPEPPEADPVVRQPSLVAPEYPEPPGAALAVPEPWSAGPAPGPELTGDQADPFALPAATTEPNQEVLAHCANCGNPLQADGCCPHCDGPADDQHAAVIDDSPSMFEINLPREEDLAAILPPEEGGVCPTCGGPMESDGSCLICPPPPASDQAGGDRAMIDTAPDSEGSAFGGTVPSSDPWGEAPMARLPANPALEHAGFSDVPDFSEPSPTLDAPPMEEGGGFGTAGAPLSGPTLAASNQVESAAGGFDPAPDSISDPIFSGNDAFAESQFAETAPETDFNPSVPVPEGGAESSGTEPPPSIEVMEQRPADREQRTAEVRTAAQISPRSSVKNPGTGVPRSLRGLCGLVALLATCGLALQITDHFILAGGVYFVALLSGVVGLFGAMPYLSRISGGAIKLPKPVLVIILLNLLFFGGFFIVRMVITRSGLQLMESAETELQALADQVGPEAPGIGPGASAAGAEAGSEAADPTRQPEESAYQDTLAEIEKEGSDLQQSIIAWEQFLDTHPDGPHASEVKGRLERLEGLKQRENALLEVQLRDRHGNPDPAERIADWTRFRERPGMTGETVDYISSRIEFWHSRQATAALLDHSTLPYWAKVRLDDGREFSGKVYAEREGQIWMELGNRLKMNFTPGRFEIVDRSTVNGRRVEAEELMLSMGLVTDKPNWGAEEQLTILSESRSAVETTLDFRLFGYYRFDLVARGTADDRGYPTIVFAVDGHQRESIRVSSADWELYSVTMRITPGTHRLEIFYPPQTQTFKDTRTVAIDQFTILIVE